MLKLDISAVTNFNKTVNGTARSDAAKVSKITKPRSKYCDITVVPQIGHTHRIRCNASNSHLLDQYFVIVDIDEHKNLVLEHVSGKNITFKKKTKNNIKTELLPQITRPKGDLVVNPENVYTEKLVGNVKVKKSRKTRTVRVLEVDCVIKLTNCDPMVNNCAFLLTKLIVEDDVCKASFINGKKLPNAIFDEKGKQQIFNPLDYLDEIEGGYSFVVVASAKEVRENTHPLFGYCKDAYAELLNPACEPTVLEGLMCVIGNVAKVRQIPLTCGIIHEIHPKQLEVLNGDIIPLGERVSFDTDISGDYVKLIGIDV